MEDRPRRLFIGLWPDEGVRRELLAHQSAWQWPASAAMVAPDRLHLTLHFLGDVEQPRIGPLVEALTSVRVPSFVLRFTRCELWRGGIAVLGTSAPPGLLQLHSSVGEALHQQGLPTEARPYRPHVTMARKASGATPAPQVPGLPWRVQAFSLIESIRAGGYASLSSHPCQGDVSPGPPA